MESKQNRFKILVADDEPTNLKLLRGILREEYTLIFARNGEEMLQYAAEMPDLILLDIMMPGMDGYEACRRLKANEATQDIPVIFVTAKIDMEDEIRGFEVGAVDYITKPVRAPVVRARVKTHLALKQAQAVVAKQHEEIMRQNSALLAAAKLRDDVEQIVRHDLKCPLNVVIGMPSFLVEHLQLQGEEEALLMSIQESGFRMLEMINRSHDLYKMERGAYQVDLQPVDVMMTLKRIAAELHTLILEKSLTLAVFLNGTPAMPGDVFMVSGEELLCHSMLSNIIKNGVEASPESASLSIHLDRKEQALLRIGNKGCVPPEILERFFEKNVTSGKRNGVGLGTYSAKLMATTMGGEMRLDTSVAGETFIEIRLRMYDG